MTLTSAVPELYGSLVEKFQELNLISTFPDNRPVMKLMKLMKVMKVMKLTKVMGCFCPDVSSRINALSIGSLKAVLCPTCRYGDMRVMMTYELFNMWQNLGEMMMTKALHPTLIIISF